MKEYYWINKEHGYLVPDSCLYIDAEEMGYEDILDPTSVEYDNFDIYYEITDMFVSLE